MLLCSRYRLVESVNFETDEALLTGESVPVQKDCDATYEPDTGPGDRLNIAYSSSSVTRGRARGITIATGMSTEIGSIAAALRASGKRRRPVKRDAEGHAKKRWYVEAWTLTGTDAIGRFLGVNVGTPLQRKLSKLAVLLFGVAVVFAIIVMGSNNWSSSNEVILYAIGTGLSMIPACLVVVLTVTMAVGTKRMVARNGMSLAFFRFFLHKLKPFFSDCSQARFPRGIGSCNRYLFGQNRDSDPGQDGRQEGLDPFSRHLFRRTDQ